MQVGRRRGGEEGGDGSVRRGRSLTHSGLADDDARVLRRMVLVGLHMVTPAFLYSLRTRGSNREHIVHAGAYSRVSRDAGVDGRDRGAYSRRACIKSRFVESGHLYAGKGEGGEHIVSPSPQRREKGARTEDDDRSVNGTPGPQLVRFLEQPVFALRAGTEGMNDDVGASRGSGGRRVDVGAKRPPNLQD